MRHAARPLLAAVIAVAWLAGCTPQQALLASALPDGTLSTLFGHFQRVEDTNRQRLVELERNRDWRGMIKFAEENLERGGPRPEWWLVAGHANTQLGNHARAIECHTEAVRLEPDEIFAWELLAQSYRAAGQPERAVRALENILLVKREVPTAYVLLGESYSDLHRWRPALQAYRQAINLDEALAPAWFGAGRAHARLGQSREAGEALRRLEKLNPALATALQRELKPR